MKPVKDRGAIFVATLSLFVSVVCLVLIGYQTKLMIDQAQVMKRFQVYLGGESSKN